MNTKIKCSNKLQYNAEKQTQSWTSGYKMNLLILKCKKNWMKLALTTSARQKSKASNTRFLECYQVINTIQRCKWNYFSKSIKNSSNKSQQKWQEKN